MAKSPNAFRTIGEVSEWLDTPTHVIRFWESRFEEINPVQKEGGRRYFRPNDLRVMGGLKKLLHDDGLTIKAVQSMIAEQGVDAVMDLSPPVPDSAPDEEASDTDDAAQASDEPMLLSDPVQKPMLLVAEGEILEPNHKWHLTISPQTPKPVLQDALSKLEELRGKLSTEIPD